MALEITIDQNEIETAIRNHVGNMLTIRDGQNVSISLKAGRGENGFSATIEIGGSAQTDKQPEQQTAAAPTVTGPFKRGLKAAQTQAEPEASQKPVETTPIKTATDAQTTGSEEQADPVATAGDDAGLDEAPTTDAPQKKGGLFAHLGNRTGTDKAE